MANEIEIPLKLSGVQSLKAELRSLKAAIAEASDPEQMAALAARAGEVADRIKDANDAVNVFASGSKFEQISNSFGGIRDSLMSLDFEEASTKAQTFSKTLGSLNAADISKGLKGLTSTVTTMGGAFIKLGMQLLVNPIFLLAAVITAIVVAVVAFLKKIGVLDKIFNAINAALKPLIDGFKQLTEWLGLSTAASDDAAEKVKANNEKIVASSKERAEAQSKSIDQEIQLAQSLGKETTKLEIEKTKVTERESKKRLAQTQKDLKELVDKRGVLAEQERARLKKQMQDENAIIRQAQVDRKVIINKAAKEDADEAKAQAAKDAEDAKKRAEEAAKKYKEGKAAIQAEIAAANKLVLDSNKTQEQKEIDDVKAKYAKLIAEAKKYKQDVTALTAAQDLEINNIRKAGADEFTRIETKKSTDIVKGMVDTRTKTLQIQGEGNMTSRQQQIEYNDAVIKAEEELAQAKLGAAKGVIAGLTELAGENKKLANALFLVDKALAIGEIIVNTQKEISAYSANPTWSLLPDGGLALKTAAIAGAKIRAATSIGTIVASSISKFMNGGGASVQTPSGGGGGGGSANVGNSSVPSFVPGNLFGQGNAANNVTAPTGMESGQNITVTAVVSETEITATQNKVNKIMKNSVL
jgi:hypothetical protein